MTALIRRWLIWFCVPALMAVVGLVGEAFVPIGIAEAQEKVKRRSLIQMLFSPRRARTEKTSRQPARSVSKRPKKRSSGSRAKVAQRAPAVEKLENAIRVMVVGDFMASALAKGLQEAFRESPGVVILERTKGSSGLVRDDYYDWPEQLPAFLDEDKPSIVIVMIGSNDRQPIRLGGESADVMSDSWLAEYTSRVKEVATAIRSKDAALLWVGAPAYKSASMSAGMLAFNGIFRSVSGDAEGEFIDIWDGFVDENGKFIYTGSDIKGQQVRLRTSDGIRMTRSGRRKLAFYVEKPVRRLLGDAVSTDVAKLGEDNLPELLMLDPNLGGSQVVRTQPIDMNDPELDGALALLGSSAPQPSPTRTPREDLILDGKTAEAPPGRADYFVWPPGSNTN